MKKQYYLLGSILTFTAMAANADELIAQSQKDKQSKNKKQQQQREFVTTQPKAMITPTVAPRVRDGVGLILTADFIWWKTTISNMSYATTGVVDGGTFVPLGSSTKMGHVVEPDFDFQPGFKFGAGLDFAYDGWDFYADWTWLNTDAEKNSIHARSGDGATTLFSLVEQDGTINTVNISKESSVWRQHFDVIDFELGRNFFISRRLTLRPHFGLKTAWIHENWKLKFTEVDKLVDPTKALQKRKQKLWGIGTRAGLNTVWHFCKNWGLYGDIAATALWSDFHVKAKDRVIVSGSATFPEPVNTFKTRQVLTKITPVFETNIGLTYMYWFNKDEYLLQFSAGWEEQIWLDFNNFVDFERTGNLSVHGLTVKAGFAF